MIKVEHIETFGFEGSLRGMRNPMNSWYMSDSKFGDDVEFGENDLRLITQLTSAGESHRKMLRMFHIQMDVTAPLYWWKDYDTYKVGTVANSCSTMHKIHAEKFTLDMFAHDQLSDIAIELLSNTIDVLNIYRDTYVESGLKDKQSWYSMIQLLPSSYLQKRTIDLNYETALKIICDRERHKLNEFREFTAILKVKLPYMEEILRAARK